MPFELNCVNFLLVFVAVGIFLMCLPKMIEGCFWIAVFFGAILSIPLMIFYGAYEFIKMQAQIVRFKMNAKKKD